jgi:flagellar basal body-associated protein FliL
MADVLVSLPGMPSSAVLLLCLCCAAAGAAEGPVADPAQAVVAEGSGLYLQRDLDALLLVAMRHVRSRALPVEGRSAPVSSADEDQVRRVLIEALVAREALVAALAQLPPRVSPSARDAIAIDLLAYQAEPNPRAVQAGSVAAAPGPVLVRLPPCTVTRTVEGQGRRQLTLGLALAFVDAASAQLMEAQAPLIQDAVLGALRAAGSEVFLDPDHAQLKLRLGEAIRARIPAFPVDGLLIPQLESGPADQPADR